MSRTASLFLFLALSLTAADSQWVVAQSTLSYHVSHPLHQIDGEIGRAHV